MKKTLSIGLAAILLCVLIAGTELLGGFYFLFLVLTGNDAAAKEEIFSFVQENSNILQDAIADNTISDFANRGIIQDIYIEDTTVDFSCGGSGVGSGTSYVGFYYTPDNDMTALWCAPSSLEDLIPSGNGYEWKESGGDNWYYTERICECFYYHEASF